MHFSPLQSSLFQGQEKPLTLLKLKVGEISLLDQDLLLKVCYFISDLLQEYTLILCYKNIL